MTFKDYQKEANTTALYGREPGIEWLYPVLGLPSEAGEVLGKFKKIYRDNGGVICNADKRDIQAELGDVLWYVSQIATELKLDMDEIAGYNLTKLRARVLRGTIKGSGDNR